MRNKETKQEQRSLKCLLGAILGGLLALGIELIVLMLGSVAVSAGVIRLDASPQVTTAACLLGCFIGGWISCLYFGTRCLFCGLLTGIICFVLIVLVALIGGDIVFDMQALVEFAGCLVGGGLAGILCQKKRRKRRKMR